jgi:apolipoprotein D and lipocalin family protein
MMRFLPLLLPLLFVGCASAPKAPPLRTVDYVDMDRYLGRWYVIANIPYFLEKGKVASYDTYARRPDGTLVNDFTFRKGDFSAPEKTWHGSAWVVNTQTNAEWKVRFVWPFTATYLVLELDPDYRWPASVSYPTRRMPASWSVFARRASIRPRSSRCRSLRSKSFGNFLPKPSFAGRSDATSQGSGDEWC